jgi:membrane protein YqaA with SNARE-associated domain
MNDLLAYLAIAVPINFVGGLVCYWLGYRAGRKAYQP